MYFFPVRVFFHIYFNTYFFSSVASAFYYRSFQPRFYDFIKFRFSKLTFGFYDYKNFFNFSNLIFPGTFFNPTRFTRQFYWFSFFNAESFSDSTPTTLLNDTSFSTPYLDIVFSGTERGFFSKVFTNFFPYKRFILTTNYFTNKGFLTNFYSYNTFNADFSTLYKFRSPFSSKLTKSFFTKRVLSSCYSEFFDSFLVVDNKFDHQFFSSNYSNFQNENLISNFYYTVFYKYYNPMRFRFFQPDFFRFPKVFRSFADFVEINKLKWPFERNRLPKYYRPFFSFYSTIKRRKNKKSNSFKLKKFKRLNFKSYQILTTQIDNADRKLTKKTKKFYIQLPKSGKFYNVNFIFSVLKFYK